MASRTEFAAALNQAAAERGVDPQEILDIIKDAIKTAYKKDYGKKGQIIRAKFDLNTGTTDFYQVKIAVDERIQVCKP